MSKLVYDIETNGLLNVLDTIHCINIFDLESRQHERYDPLTKPIEQGVERLERADLLIGHNIIGFDIPATQKVFPGWEPKGEQLDTYVYAACVWPDIEKFDWPLFRKGILPAGLIGRFSLEAFGYRLGELKGEFAKQTDWSEWTPEMSDYCEQDVTVNVKLYERLMQKEVSEEQIRLEHSVRRILGRQERYGVYFNIECAKDLYIKLSTRLEELREKITKSFPPFYKRKGKLFTPKRDMKKRAGEWVGYVAGAKMQKIELTEFNPGSTDHIARMLMSKYNWIPHEFTDKAIPPIELQHHYDRLGITAGTSPKIDDEVLKRLSFPEAKPLTEFQLLKKRIAQIATGKEAWLKHYNEFTGRIHGGVNQFGAVTGRCTHSQPNLAQVPSNRSEYGEDCRACFTVPKGKKLVGCDADGLEACCMAHFIYPYDNGRLVKVILEGDKSKGTDIHSANRDILGLKSRDVAKTFYYAFGYGAGDLKLGMILMEDAAYENFDGDPAVLGKKKRETFKKKFPGLKKLINAVQKAAKRGFLWGLDGRKIPIRSLHAALNSLLQSAGAVIMKKALEIADSKLQDAGLTPGRDYEFVLNVHDEFQAEVDDVELHWSYLPDFVGQYMSESIKEAGEYFNFKCPLSGGYDIGDNWSQTH